MKQTFFQFGNSGRLAKITSRRMGLNAANSYKNSAYKSDGDDDDDDDDDDEPKNSPTKVVIKKLDGITKKLAKTATVDELNTKATDLEKKATDGIKKAKEDLEKVIGEVKVIADEADKRSKELDKKAGQFGNPGGDGKKTFGFAYKEAIKAKSEEMAEEAMKSGSFNQRIQLKDVGVMTTATHLTGTGVVSYNPNPTLKPSQKIRFRDLVPTTPSPTGIFSTYSETGGEGGPDWQSTEALKKANMDIKFTETKTISKPLAATVDFGRLMMKNLPFLETTLPRILLRKFFAKESISFYNKVKAVVGGGGSTTETNKVKKLIDYIASLRDADYEAGFILLSNTTLAALNKAMIDAGSNYQGLGGIVSNADGSLSINNTSIIPASFVPNGETMILDPDYIERVETESITIDFSEHNKDNFEKNLVTARIECFEELNILDPMAHAWKTL